MSREESFFTVVGCMDGRIQEPVVLYGRNRFGAQYPDTITEPGIVRDLASPKTTEELIESIKHKITISTKIHASAGIVVNGHQECAGNPVNDDMHKEHVLGAVETIRDLVEGEVSVVGVFVVRTVDGWEAQELS